MAYPWTGRVLFDTTTDGGLSRLRVQWKLDASGVATRCVGPVDGTLHRFVSFHEDSALSANYNVYLYDRWDCDSLNGLGAGLAHNTTTDKTLRALLTADQPTALLAEGPQVVVVTLASGTTQSFGVFDLYYLPRIDGGMVNGGLH